MSGMCACVGGFSREASGPPSPGEPPASAEDHLAIRKMKALLSKQYRTTRVDPLHSYLATNRIQGFFAQTIQRSHAMGCCESCFGGGESSYSDPVADAAARRAAAEAAERRAQQYADSAHGRAAQRQAQEMDRERKRQIAGQNTTPAMTAADWLN